MELKRIAMNPWDFTLYESKDGSFVLKVIFSEGEYKVDIGRYFIVDPLSPDNMTIEALKELSARIRTDYPNVSFPQVEKSNLKIGK
jgi:phage terminase large subunit-like protein